jgi:hypothetical protein
MITIQNIIDNYNLLQQNYQTDNTETDNSFNHVKNINDINTIFFNNNVDIDRIVPTALELLKNPCLIENCKKIVCYQLNFTNNKKITKYICWHHLCDLIQNYQ